MNPMRKVLITAAIILLVLIVGGAIVENMVTRDKSSDARVPYLRGFVYNGYDNMRQFLDHMNEDSRIMAWYGDWNEGRSGGAAFAITEIAKQYNFTPLVIFQFFHQDNGQLLRPLDNANRENYREIVENYVEKYNPRWLGLGIEVNLLYEKNPQYFDEFVSFYNDVYDDVKAKSPETKIFTVFQLEAIKGLSGLSGSHPQAWQLIDKFKLDAVGFTTYPELVFKKPSEIPDNYYAEIVLHTSKPILFTEVAWASKPLNAMWDADTTENTQAEFVARFFNLTKGFNKELVVWAFMHDLPDSFGVFKDMGLRTTDDTAKLAWDVWVGS